MKHWLFRVRAGFIGTFTAIALIAALLAVSIELPVRSVYAQGGFDPCSGTETITTSLNITSDTVIGIGSTNRFWHLCGIAFTGTSTSLFQWKITSGTGTTCQTSVSDRTGAISQQNSSLQIMGYTGRTLVRTETAADDMFIDLVATGPSMQGTISIVNAP